MSREEVEKILQELLENLQVYEFSINFIARSGATEDTIRNNYKLLRSFGVDNDNIARNATLLSLDPNLILENYRILKEYGLSDNTIARHPEPLGRDPETIRSRYEMLRELGIGKKGIARHPELLVMNPDTIRSRYERLKELGIGKKGIARYPQLLGRDPKTIRSRYEMLRELGIGEKGIARHPELLVMNPDTIRSRYERLKELGIGEKGIARHPELLGMDPKTIRAKYEKLIGLLREPLDEIYPEVDNSYKREKIEKLSRSDKYRNSGREILRNMPQLLVPSQETIEGNIQYLYSIGIDYHKYPILLETKPNKKREKVAWMLRELFDYDNEENLENKRNVINRLYEFLRDHPYILSYSLSKLNEKKNKLKYIARRYK
ncbi:MAG: hypothetical protein QXJ20_01860 [Candidatus Aenigmatarchaeota archaeon]